MPSKLSSLKQRIRRSRPQTSDNQLQTRKHYLRTSIISFADRFWPGNTTVISRPTSHIDPPDDIAMNAIQMSLAVLVTGSSLASKLPFISPIAGLLLQALTMRDARVPYNSSDNILTSASAGSKPIQRGVQNSDPQTRQNCEDYCQPV
jgi:hypothetical protein